MGGKVAFSGAKGKTGGIQSVEKVERGSGKEAGSL